MTICCIKLPFQLQLVILHYVAPYSVSFLSQCSNTLGIFLNCQLWSDKLMCFLMTSSCAIWYSLRLNLSATFFSLTCRRSNTITHTCGCHKYRNNIKICISFLWAPSVSHYNSDLLYWWFWYTPIQSSIVVNLLYLLQKKCNCQLHEGHAAYCRSHFQGSLLI